MKTQNAGIDYGAGKTNVDSNGIRYGVISQNAVVQAWGDSSEPYYGEHAYCPYCGTESKEEPFSEFRCGHCGEEVTENDYDGLECDSFILNDKEYTAQSDSYGDIFITKSPYYTMAQYCSPCAPGAGYIMNECENGAKAYCFGHDWFDSGKAPYTVYRVSDNSIVNPE